MLTAIHLVSADRKIVVQRECYKPVYPLQDKLLSPKPEAPGPNPHALSGNGSHDRIRHSSTNPRYRSMFARRIYPVAQKDDEDPSVPVNPE